MALLGDHVLLSILAPVKRFVGAVGGDQHPFLDVSYVRRQVILSLDLINPAAHIAAPRLRGWAQIGSTVK